MHAGLHIYCSHATKLGYLATRCINEYKILYNKSEFCLLKYWLRFLQLKEWTGVCYHPDFATTTVIVRFCPVSVSELSHRVDLLNLGMVGVILSTIVRVQFHQSFSLTQISILAIVFRKHQTIQTQIRRHKNNFLLKFESRYKKNTQQPF